ncbi:MAG: radical SAM protein [Deltaproteobacteria bacterium]|nr:radical SAM protein [Deltaproteobacteria bacterium]MBW2307592.1 radical SAM protein [Deltaproteobacteria bacterium]
MNLNLSHMPGASAGEKKKSDPSGEVHVQIQTTSQCNARCVFCPYPDSWHARNPGRMSHEVFEKILAELKPFRIGKICPYFENEPLMDPHLLNRIERIKAKLQFRCLEVSTNGHLLTPRISRRLIDALRPVGHEVWISIPGVNAEDYRRTTGLDFHLTMKRVINFLKIAGGGIRVRIRGAGRPWRESRVGWKFSEEQFRESWNHIFLTHGIQTANIKLEYLRYHDRAGNIKRNPLRFGEIRKIGPENPFYCSRIDRWFHFLYTGELCICCMDYHRQEIIGDIRIQSLREILDSDTYRKCRDRLMGLTPSSDDFICKHCIHPGG